ncbi:tyrosinase family oxidase copper chaperone [Streptomyces sp. SP17KL33]|uniref:tyrosinase family oxidase copper chaperone n=1 Tax=Streptomyces sp. SP17KL33 TaxID=3002534 RepID=UPI002E7A1381|nr:tyrosinase family oxidase copper chaperone [Streptomyces sp. SP17KL33]MEE1834787.1 tyrosinase family oxidase copper chaperone [Streptomyces sp. SP17KL33]
MTVDPAAGRSGTRRNALRALGVSALALAVAPVVAAAWPRRSARPEEAEFDETYRGRRIRGSRTDTGQAAYLGARAPGVDTWGVTVDGRPLHLMRRADGTYLSMIDHYRSYPTALEATRAAVDELGMAQRLRVAAMVEGAVGHGLHA